MLKDKSYSKLIKPALTLICLDHFNWSFAKWGSRGVNANERVVVGSMQMKFESFKTA
jgi:hypothetical protein